MLVLNLIWKHFIFSIFGRHCIIFQSYDYGFLQTSSLFLLKSLMWKWNRIDRRHFFLVTTVTFFEKHFHLVLSFNICFKQMCRQCHKYFWAYSSLCYLQREAYHFLFYGTNHYQKKISKSSFCSILMKTARCRRNVDKEN